MPTESFRPSVHGFAFTNTFGDCPGLLGLGAPVHPGFGLGAGMAWAALDRFLAGRPMDAALTPPQPGERLHAELMERQANAVAAAQWSRLVAWQCMPDAGRPGRPGLAGLTRAQWRGVRAQLDRGTPVLLFLVLARGRHANPSLNRAVLAVGYDREAGTKRVAIRIYDPDRPKNDGVRLVFQAGRASGLDARLAVHTEVRGFFAVPYDRPLPARLEMERADIPDCHMDRILAVHPAGRGGAMQLLGGKRDGGLVRVRRTRGDKWVVEALDGGKRGAVAGNGGGPAVRLSADRIVTRSAAGAVLELRRMPGVGWRARDLTSRQGIGERFRIDAAPAAVEGARTGTSIVGCARGTLVRYHRSRVGGWHAEELTFGPLRQMTFNGTPAICEDRSGTLHVLARSETGELMHLRLVRKTGWVAENATSRAGTRDRFSLAADPVLRVGRARDQLEVAGRSSTGDVLLFRWNDARGWRGVDLSTQARAAGMNLPAIDSAIAADLDAEGTMHVVGCSARGGLVHAWCTAEGALGGGEITFSRQRIGESGRLDGVPQVAAGPGPLLHVLGRQGDEVILYRWSPIADWSVENLTRERRARDTARITGEPVLSVDRTSVRAAFVDGEGRVYGIVIEAAPAAAFGDALQLQHIGPVAGVVTAPVTLVAAVAGAVAGALGDLLGGGRASQPGDEPVYARETGRAHAPRVERSAQPVLGSAGDDLPVLPDTKTTDIATGVDAVGRDTRSALAESTPDPNAGTERPAGLIDWTPAEMFATPDAADAWTPTPSDEWTAEPPVVDFAALGGAGAPDAAEVPAADANGSANDDADAEDLAALATDTSLLPAEPSHGVEAANVDTDAWAPIEVAGPPATPGEEAAVTESRADMPWEPYAAESGEDASAAPSEDAHEADPAALFPFEEEEAPVTQPAGPEAAPPLDDLTLRPPEEAAADPWTADHWGPPPPVNPIGVAPAAAAELPDDDPWAPAAGGTGQPDSEPPLTQPAGPRRRVNPALEGLPLLTEEDGKALEAGAGAKPAPLPATAPPKPARPAARPKPRRSLLEMEQVMALADANAPKVLPPDGKP